jgi:hypothetical protein
MAFVIHKNNSLFENLIESISLISFLTRTIISFSLSTSDTELSEVVELTELVLELLSDVNAPLSDVVELTELLSLVSLKSLVLLVE